MLAGPLPSSTVSDEAIRFEHAGGVARVTLNRPDRLNAITWPMIETILDIIDSVGTDDSVRVLVFRGAGRVFSSGDDIVDGMGERTHGGDPDGITVDRGLHYQLFRSLLELPKPTIASIHGRCHGAGFVLSLACDFRVAPSDALV